MRSIRGRITLWLAIGMTALSVVTGSGLYVFLHRMMLAEFDRSLAVRVHTLQSLVTQKPSGEFDIDVHTSALPEYADETSGEFYRITDAAGKVVTTSAQDPLQHIESSGRQPADVFSLAGVHLRVTSTTFVPEMEDGEAEPSRPATAARPGLTLIVARSREQLDHRLNQIALAIFLAMAALSVSAAMATLWITRTGLATLRSLATRMAAVDFKQAGAQFDVSSVPTEMAEVVERFNQMLRRVANTLARERRFTADVAHELRTPIAELRSAADVATRFPSAASHSRTVTQASEIARQMQTLVTSLLAIVRDESLAATVRPAPLELTPILNRVMGRHGMNRTDGNTATGIFVVGEPTLLEAMLDNVIGNAFHYAASKKSVGVSYELTDSSIVLSVENDQHSLTGADLPHVFEPFWRKDAARSDGQHAGLGLSLVQAYCNALDVAVVASLPQLNRFRIAFTFARSTPPLTAAPSKAQALQAATS